MNYYISAPYNPYDWYWLADDNRVYASARQLIVDNTDTTYATWAQNNAATPWPRDDANNQTDASLQNVLNSYGNLFVNLIYYAAYARWCKETAGAVCAGTPLRTDRLSQSQRDATLSYLNLVPTATVQWKIEDGSFVTLDKATLEDQMKDTAGYVQDCFACEKQMQDGIAGGTVTTRQQIDAAFAAISNQR